MRGFHVYKDLWSLPIGQEDLECSCEKENGKYQFAIAVCCNDLCHKLVVVHVPLTFSKVLFKLLQQLNSILTYKVTGKQLNRGAGYGLAVPITYTCTGLKKVVAWIQRKISGEMETTGK